MPYIWEKEWWTGRSEKEADVYANFDKVDEVVTNIKKIKTNEVADAQDAVKSAINDLNNVNGMAQFVGNISVDAFDGYFEGIGSTVEDIANQLQQKAENIKIYAEATDDQKAASTTAMLLFKAGEGFLSVVEDLGDAAFSVMGWTSGKLAALAGVIDKNNKDEYKKAAQTIQDGFANVIDKEWSHDAFNFYYKSDFAKMSDITEEGGTAKLAKLAGEIGGYYVTGSAITKAFTASGKLATVTSKGVQALEKVANSTGKVGQVAKTVFNASKATYGNAALIGTTSYGSHTESNLRQGFDFDTSVRKAAGSATKDAALAFAIGRGLEAGGAYLKGKKAAPETSGSAGEQFRTAGESPESIDRLGKNLADSQRKLDAAYSKGASEAELGALEEARDVASKAYAEAGGNASELRNAASDLEKAQSKLDTAYRGGKASEAELGALEEARDAAKKSLDGMISKEGTAAPKVTEAKAGEQFRTTGEGPESIDELGKKLADSQRKLDAAHSRGASEAELGKLEGTRDAASKAYAEAGGNASELRNAASDLEKAQSKLDTAYRGGKASEAELGALEEARDAAKKSLDGMISKEGTAAPKVTEAKAGEQFRTTGEANPKATQRASAEELKAADSKLKTTQSELKTAKTDLREATAAERDAQRQLSKTDKALEKAQGRLNDAKQAFAEAREKAIEKITGNSGTTPEIKPAATAGEVGTVAAAEVGALPSIEAVDGAEAGASAARAMTEARTVPTVEESVGKAATRAETSEATGMPDELMIGENELLPRDKLDEYIDQIVARTETSGASEALAVEHVAPVKPAAPAVEAETSVAKAATRAETSEAAELREFLVENNARGGSRAAEKALDKVAESQKAVEAAQKEVDALTETRGAAAKTVEEAQATRASAERELERATAANIEAKEVRAAANSAFKETLPKGTTISQSVFGGINKTADEAYAAKQIELNNSGNVARPVNNITGASGDADVIIPPTGNSGTSTGVEPVVDDGYQPTNGGVDNGGGGNGNVQFRDTGGSSYTPSVNPPSGTTNPGTTGGGNSDTLPGTTGGGNQTPPGTEIPTSPSDNGTGVDNGSSSTTPTTPTNPSGGSSNNPTNPSQSVTTPSDDTPDSGTTQHSGGGYTGTGGYIAADHSGNSSGGHSGAGGYTATSNGGRYYGGGTSGETITTPPEEFEKDLSKSMDEIIKGNKYTKIPTASTPITSKKTGGGSAVIPIAAGLSAAAAAGIGAKAYMDKKNNTEADDYDDDSEEWSDEDTIDLSDDQENSTEYETYDDSDEYLSEDDEYGYQTEEVEKYGARNSEELADLQ